MKARILISILGIFVFLCTGCEEFKNAVGFPSSADNLPLISRSQKAEKFDMLNFYGLCAGGTKKQVSSAIAKGASVNALDENGFSPLFYAVVGNPKKYSDSITALQNALKKDDDDALYKALQFAPCVKGNYEAVKLLLEHGANVQLTDRRKNTSFLYACLFCSDVNILKALVNSGADITEKLSANYPQSLLTWASFTNTSPECIKYIAYLGKNIGEKNQFGTTPIMWAAMYNPNPAVIDALIYAGADINDPGHKDGYTPLHWAIRCNRSTEVAEHIIKLGADINKEDKYGSTPLLWAVCNNNPKDVVRIMDLAFSDMDYFYQFNLPKYFANFQQKGKPELVPLLLKYNPTTASIIEAYQLAYCLSSADIANALLAKLDATEGVKYDDTDLILMCCSNDDKKINALKKVLLKSENVSFSSDSGLLVALMYGNPKMIKILTEDFNVSVDYDTAKYVIDYTHNSEYLNLIIASCKNVNKQNSSGQTLLNYAVDKGNLAAVNALISNGAKIDMRYGDNYYTELLTAVNRSYPNDEIVRVLLRAGADVNARDKAGASVLVYAVNKNRTTTTIQTLINYGADKTAKYKGEYVYYYCNDYIDETSVYRTLRNAVSNSYYDWY